jgi:hypothetical protein
MNPSLRKKVRAFGAMPGGKIPKILTVTIKGE